MAPFRVSWGTLLLPAGSRLVIAQREKQILNKEGQAGKSPRTQRHRAFKRQSRATDLDETCETGRGAAGLAHGLPWLGGSSLAGAAFGPALERNKKKERKKERERKKGERQRESSDQ